MATDYTNIKQVARAPIGYSIAYGTAALGAISMIAIGVLRMLQIHGVMHSSSFASIHQNGAFAMINVGVLVALYSTKKLYFSLPYSESQKRAAYDLAKSKKGYEISALEQATTVFSVRQKSIYSLALAMQTKIWIETRREPWVVPYWKVEFDEAQTIYLVPTIHLTINVLDDKNKQDGQKDQIVPQNIRDCIDDSQLFFAEQMLDQCDDWSQYIFEDAGHGSSEKVMRSSNAYITGLGLDRAMDYYAKRNNKLIDAVEEQLPPLERSWLGSIQRLFRPQSRLINVMERDIREENIVVDDLKERNETMVTTAMSKMREKQITTATMAIGAAHNYGEHSVPKIFENRGATVTFVPAPAG